MSAKRTYDVIVVGAGGSGLACAVSAAEHGADVLVLEKRPQPGGTTGIAVGSFTAAETEWQKRNGIDDSAAEHVVDAGLFADPEIEARNHAGLRKYFLQEAARTLDWLSGYGLTFVGPQPEPPNRVPRMHNVVPGAKAYIAALQLALQRLNGTIQCNVPVTRLIKTGCRVTGVHAEIDGREMELTARRAVVLAAGDYANNPDTIARFKGERFREIEGINPFATGDGHRLADDAGADLLNMEVTYGPELRFVPSSKTPFQQWLPSSGFAARLQGLIASRLPRWIMRAMIKRLLVTWQHPENALFDDGAVLVNRLGQRFCDETVWPDREIAVARQPDKVAWILLDTRLVERYSAWPHFISTAPDIAYAYVRDYERLRPDVAVSGSIPKIASRHGIDPASIGKSIDVFNAYADGRQADPFGRTGDAHRLSGERIDAERVEKERPNGESSNADGWVLLGPVKAYFTTTEGGVRVSERLEAIDTNGDPIPGLYAVGQNGLGGMILWGHGLHIAWAMTSGRLAGKYVSAAPASSCG